MPELSTQTDPAVSDFLPYKLLTREDLEDLNELLSRPQRVVITTHHKPDADALGSSLALRLYLMKRGHTVQVITPSDYPHFLNWMPGQETVLMYEKGKSSAHLQEFFLNAELIFCLDFNSLARIHDLGEWVKQSAATRIMVDHHLQPDPFARFQVWDSRAASTTELIFDLVTLLGDHKMIDLPMAECIYAGLMTDTGSFRHPSTNRTVHLIVADLLRIGVNPSKIHKLVYDNSNLNRLRFLGFVLKDKLTVLPDFHAAYIAITKDEIKEYQVDTGDTEGIVNFALALTGIVLGVVVIDRTEMVKLSFRSLGDFDVNTFARSYFEGGGHKNASGGKSDVSLENTVERLLDAISENKNQLAEAYEQYYSNL